MKPAPVPKDEAERLGALRRYEILDTLAGDEFDDFTFLSAQICRTPIALVSLADKERLWFKSRYGLEAAETPRDNSFCNYAIRGEDVFEVPDATVDQRFRDNPLVTASPGVRFYAGAPLIAPGGYCIGTLCVLDHVPRRLVPSQREALQRLSRQVVARMEMRLDNRRLTRQSAFHAAILANAACSIIATTSDGVITHFNPEAERMLGYDAAEMIERQTPAVFHEPAEVAARASELSRELNCAIAPGFEVFVAKARKGLSETREWTYVRKDGSRFPAMLSISALRDTNGHLSGFLGIGQDVTERREMEAALRDSEAYNRILFQESQQAIGIVDPNTGRIIDCNPAAVKIYGFASREETLEKTVLDVSAPTQYDGTDSRTASAARDAAALETGIEIFDWRHQRPDGTIWDAEVRLMRFTHGGRKLLQFCLADVTERKRQAAEIHRANFLADVALELTDSGYWYVDYSDPDYYVQSERAARILGEPLRPDGRYHLGTEWFARLEEANTETAIVAAERYQGAIDGKYDMYDAIYAYKRPSDGEVVWIHAAGKPLRDAASGKALFMYGAYQDITQRRKAEDEVRRANVLADAALDLTDSGYWYIDFSDPGYYFASDRATHIFGEPVRPEGRYHLATEWLARIEEANPEIAAATAERYQGAVDGKYDKYDAIYAYKRPADGEVVWIRAAGKLVRDTTSGKALFMYGVCQDITQQKKSEEEIRQARELALEATRAKSNFLASMSHEIRTPMNGVTAMAELLAQTDLNDDQRHMLRTIRESGNALITVINDILDFSKIEAGRLDIEDVSMSIVDAVEGVAETLTPNATGKGIRIYTFVDPAIPAAVQGDPVRLRQVLFNLTGNAVKFSEKKDVSVRAVCLPDRGDSRCWIRYEIVDQGIGISEEDQAKLFQAFSQAESSTTRRFGGTGLGLAICRRLVDLMGGAIGVSSKIGAGSTFWTELPFTVATSVRSHEKALDLKGLRVLVVASPTPRRDAIAGYLNHWGAETRFVDEDGGALDRVLTASDPFHSLVLDCDLAQERQSRIVQLVREANVTIPLIVLRDGQASGPRIQGYDIIVADANPLVRHRLVSAVAVAAGRASPEVADREEAPRITATNAPSIEEAAAQGRLILVAEDNITNQNVVRRQLNMIGYACEIVSDGVEALKALGSGRHALLLTDCHMTKMGGYELARRIREVEAEHPGQPHIPIIAYTADAMQDSRDRCLNAGMDDMLVKPGALQVLGQKLEFWLGSTRGGSESGSVSDEGGNHRGAQCPIDWSEMDEVTGGDRAFADDMLRDFLSEKTAEVATLAALLGTEELAEIQRIAHRLEGAAKTISAQSLASICQQIESAARSGDRGSIAAASQALPREFERLATWIQTRFQGVATGNRSEEA